MYPWVTHTHSHLGGECPHKCTYCYVDNPRFGRPAKYTGPIRLLEDEFKVNYGSGRTIFVENCNDLFATDVPGDMIDRVLAHCRAFPDNTYVFQTKNPARVIGFYLRMPANFLLGTTIETNRHYSDVMGKAPTPAARAEAMERMSNDCMGPVKTFVTIEPILDFDLDELMRWIVGTRPGIDGINPEFVNIGADSKGHGLPEPSGDKIRALLAALREHNIPIREKHNLQRLLV
jgi:protein gp37